MIQAYQGYFQEDGRFIANNRIIKIPINRRVIVNILEDEIINSKTAQTVDKKEIAKRKKMVKSLKGCLAGYEVDLAQIREERIAKRGLLE